MKAIIIINYEIYLLKYLKNKKGRASQFNTKILSVKVNLKLKFFKR